MSVVCPVGILSLKNLALNQVTHAPLCLQHVWGLLFHVFLGGGGSGESEISNSNLSACGLDYSGDICSL